MGNKHSLIVGVVFLLLSYAYFLFPKTIFSALLLASFFYLGLIYICEVITRNLKNSSLVSKIFYNKKQLIAFIITATIGGLILDGVAKFLGKLWIYPFWNIKFYALVFIPGFATYWLVIAETYLAAKAVFDYLIKGKKIVSQSYKYEKGLYTVLGLLGVILTTLAITLIANDFGQQNLPLYTWNSIAHITQTFQVNFLDIILLFLGSWFILEFLEFFLHRRSLIKDIIHNYYTPILAIIVGSFITAIFMELQNVPIGLWRYTNWPLSEYSLLGMPLLIFLTWPLHYIIFLSLFRTVTGKQSNEVWRGDTLK